MSKEELLKHAKYLVEEDRKISLQLIEVLRECEKRMLFAELGYGSLWQFAVEHLGLSEGSAQLRISTMRLARENPSVKDALASGKLSLSNAAQLHSFFQAEKKQGKIHTPESKKTIIASVSDLSKKECEQHLFALAPKSVPQEKQRTVSESKTELKLVLDNVLVEKLQKLKGLLAHKFPRASYGDLIEYLADQTLEQLEKSKAGSKSTQESISTTSPRPDEVKKLKKSGMQDQRKSINNGLENMKLKPEPSEKKNEAKAPTARIYISLATRQSLWRRAGGRCEFVTKDGIRCKSCYQLELDHIIPLSADGTNHFSNYRYVCRSHNLFEAKRTIGAHVMQNYVSSLK